jgi:predicted acetyltransferase
MSWLTPIVREIMADKAMTDHKLAFMENAATPNMVVKLDVQDLDKFTKWMQQFKEDHEGARTRTGRSSSAPALTSRLLGRI